MTAFPDYAISTYVDKNGKINTSCKYSLFI